MTTSSASITAIEPSLKPRPMIEASPRPEPSSTVDFRTFLKMQLLERCRKNPRYSLRAFARSLQIEPSLLSKLLSGKRRFTTAMLKRLAEKMGLSESDIGIFLESTETSPHVKRADYIQLSHDLFSMISEWQHLAILELVYVKGFKAEPEWIGRKLGMPPSDARDTLDRLFRLGFLKRDSKNQVVSGSGSHTTLGSAPTSVALRHFQASILQMGIDALENIAPEFRDQSGMTMAIRRSDLPLAKSMIKNFRRSFCRKMQSSPDKPFDDVYQLCISFFQLTKGAES